MLLKFIFHQWESRVRSENITEKKKSAIIVDIDMEKILIENYRINISKQNRQNDREIEKENDFIKWKYH